MESAKSSLIFEVVEGETTVSDAITQSIIREADEDLLLSLVP